MSRKEDMGAYKIKDLSYSYGEKKVLHNINLELPTGQFYGILGPNGCGKTTLLDLLAGLKKPQTGTVSLEGKEVYKSSKKALAKKIALVPQEFQVNLSFTVEDIVLMGRHPHIARFSAPSAYDYELVQNALVATSMDTFAAQPASQLSGGQKQRCVVARALAQNTEIILFDEATANLDIEYSLQIFRLARCLVAEGRTVIAVLHNLNLAAAYCDQLLFLKDGKKYCFGPTLKVMTEENIHAVFGVEARVGEDLYGQKAQTALRY